MARATLVVRWARWPSCCSPPSWRASWRPGARARAASPPRRPRRRERPRRQAVALPGGGARIPQRHRPGPGDPGRPLSNRKLPRNPSRRHRSSTTSVTPSSHQVIGDRLQRHTRRQDLAARPRHATARQPGTLGARVLRVRVRPARGLRAGAGGGWPYRPCPLPAPARRGIRPFVAPRIVSYEVVDHPTENQLVALAAEAVRGTRAPGLNVGHHPAAPSPRLHLVGHRTPPCLSSSFHRGEQSQRRGGAVDRIRDGDRIIAPDRRRGAAGNCVGRTVVGDRRRGLARHDDVADPGDAQTRAASIPRPRNISATSRCALQRRVRAPGARGLDRLRPEQFLGAAPADRTRTDRRPIVALSGAGLGRRSARLLLDSAQAPTTPWRPSPRRVPWQLEVNPNVPFACGNCHVHVSQVAALVESEEPILQVGLPKIGPVQRKRSAAMSPR